MPKPKDTREAKDILFNLIEENIQVFNTCPIEEGTEPALSSIDNSLFLEYYDGTEIKITIETDLR